MSAGGRAIPRRVRPLHSLPADSLYAEATAVARVGNDHENGTPTCPWCDEPIHSGDVVCRMRAVDGRSGFFYVHARCWQ